MHRCRKSLGMIAAILLAGCGTLSPPLEPPIVHLTDLRLQQAKLIEQRYLLELRLENPNPRELAIWGMTYRMTLNQVELGRGVSRESIAIPPYAEANVALELSSNVFSLMQQVRDVLAEGAQGVRFSISGSLSVADQIEPLPFSFEGQIGETPP